MDPNALAVNVFGYLEAENGLGEVARSLLASLSAAGITWSATNCALTGARQQHRLTERGSGTVHPVTIACINADQLVGVLHRGSPVFDGPYRIAVWAWETESFPRFMARVAPTVDEIWTLSEHAARAIRAATTTPTYVFAPTIVESPPTAGQTELPRGFVFLFSFDFSSIVERKNPRAAIEAFERAFAPDEGPQLVLKTVNGDRNGHQLDELRAAAGGRADIHFLDGYVSRSEQHALMHGTDAYVSLHRAEGFGLTMAEAMAIGKPVIATAYSGNVDFMTAANSCLIPFRLVGIPPGNFPYLPGSRWAEPDIAAAAEAMRRVYEDPAWAASLGRQAASDIARDHIPAARAEFLTARIRSAMATPPRHRMPALLRPTPQRMKRVIDPLRAAIRSKRR